MFHRHVNAQSPLNHVLSPSGFAVAGPHAGRSSSAAKPGQWLAQQFRSWQVRRAMNATPKDERAWQADYIRKRQG